MRELVIPDIHQRLPVLEAILERWEDEVDAVVFLGDYFDAQERAHLGAERSHRTLDWLLDSLVRPNRVHLMGNHDISYRYPAQHRCTGFSLETAALIYEEMDAEIWGRFRHAYFSQGYLYSHAGFHPSFLDGDVGEAAIEKAIGLASGISGADSELYEAGHVRGGERMKGGPLWLDWEKEFEEIENVSQIVGHTRNRGSVRYRKAMNEGELVIGSIDTGALVEDFNGGKPSAGDSFNWCLDSGLDAFGIVEDGELTIKRIPVDV